MELTFLGHQSWMIEHGSTCVLLDPVLAPNFGHTPNVDFRVWPPRRIRVAEMPPVHAIFLSHEHLDHFHLPSLDLLPRATPFYVGPLMPAVVVRAVEALGFSVQRLALEAPLRVGALELTWYPG